MCCRRRRTFNDLGHYESQFEAFATTRVHCAQSAAQIKDAQNLLSLFKFVYPALIALLSVAVIKLEWLHRLLWDYGGKWSYAAAALFVLIPMVTAIVLDRFLARRVTRLNKKGSDVAQKETKLLNEVATTLPMHQAVPLLAKYDATGTMVKKFVVADPEQTKRVESLIGDCRQLVHALGLAVATVHRMAPGGPTQAQEALAPIQPTLQKYKRELDPVLRSCGAAGLIDGPDLRWVSLLFSAARPCTAAPAFRGLRHCRRWRVCDFAIDATVVSSRRVPALSMLQRAHNRISDAAR